MLSIESNPRTLLDLRVAGHCISPLLTDGCSLELTSSYQWPESDLSPAPIEMPCSCGDLDTSEIVSGRAVRLCAGSFATGAEWEEPDLSLCQFDDFTQEICDATLVRFLGGWSVVCAI